MLTETRQSIIDFISKAKKPVKFADIQKATGISTSTIYHRLAELAKSGVIIKKESKEGFRYSLNRQLQAEKQAKKPLPKRTQSVKAVAALLPTETKPVELRALTDQLKVMVFDLETNSQFDRRAVVSRLKQTISLAE